MNDQDTRLDRIIRWFRNHPFWSIVILLVIVIVGAGAFTRAIDQIWSFIEKRIRAPVQEEPQIVRLGWLREKVREQFGSPDQDSATLDYYSSLGLRLFYDKNVDAIEGIQVAESQKKQFKGNVGGIHLGQDIVEVLDILGEPVNWEIPMAELSGILWKRQNKYIFVEISRESAMRMDEPAGRLLGKVARITFCLDPSTPAYDVLLHSALQQLKFGKKPKETETDYDLSINLNDPSLKTDYQIIESYNNPWGGKIFVVRFTTGKSLSIWIKRFSDDDDGYLSIVGIEPD